MDCDLGLKMFPPDSIHKQMRRLEKGCDTLKPIRNFIFPDDYKGKRRHIATNKFNLHFHFCRNLPFKSLSFLAKRRSPECRFSSQKPIFILLKKSKVLYLVTWIRPNCLFICHRPQSGSPSFPFCTLSSYLLRIEAWKWHWKGDETNFPSLFSVFVILTMSAKA